MATPSASSVVNFVKKYPITLCGFSLLFMPSVHRLLLYFTPLLLSTAIFIVAMLSWGPSTESSEGRGNKRSKRNEWAFNGSLKIYEDDDEEGEEEEEEEVAEVSQARKEELSLEGKASQKLEAQIQEPDPDFDEESKRVGTVSSGAIFPDQAEPDPDLGGDGVGTVSNGAITGDLHRDNVSSAAPELQGDGVGAASSAAAEPDPDLHGEHIEAAHNDNSAAARPQLHAAPDHHSPHDHAKLAPISDDEQAAGDHPDSQPDHLDYHDATSDQVNPGDDHYGDSEANQGDDYHDAKPDPGLHGSDGTTAHAKSEGAGVRVENDDVRAAIAELRQKLGLVQRAPFSDVDGCDQMHSQQIGKGLQALHAAA